MADGDERRKLLEQSECLVSTHGDRLDWDYLWRRAEEEGVAEALADVLSELERMPRQQPGESRWERAIRSGRIEILGPRCYRYNPEVTVDFTDD